MAQNYGYGYGQYQQYGYGQSYGSAVQYDARGTSYGHQSGYSSQGYGQSSVQAKLMQQAQPNSSQQAQYHTSSNVGLSQNQQPSVGYYGSGYRGQSSSSSSYQSGSAASGSGYNSGGGTSSASPATVQYPMHQQSQYSTGYKKETASSQSGGYNSGYGGGYNSGYSSQYTPQQHHAIQQYALQKQRSQSGSLKPRKAAPIATTKEATYYCEICKVSCVTAATYKTHLEGKMHKKKAVGPVPAPAGAPSFKCDLCDITCTSKDAYEAHLRGSKHYKVLALHQKLGKPIPQVKAPEMAGTGATGGPASTRQVVHTGVPPVSFVGGHTLASTGPKTAGGAEALKQSPSQNTMDVELSGGTAVGDGDGDVVGSGEDMESMEPVGEHLVVAVQKDPKFPYASFKCTMCDCYFNDEYAKRAHVKGRRHRLNFKKQYQPDLKVQPTKAQKKDLEKKRRMYEMRTGKGKGNRTSGEPGGVPGEQPNGAGGGGAKLAIDVNELRRQEQSELAKLRGQRLHSATVEEAVEEQEYYREEWSEPYPSPMVLPHHPPAMLPPRNPHDDKLVLNKHSVIFPHEAEAEAVKSITDDVIKALKSVSDDLLSDKAKSSGFSEKDESQRNLKGAMPVGCYALNLLLRGEHSSELVLMCDEKPTVSTLHTVSDQLKTKLKSFTEHNRAFSVIEKPQIASILVSSTVGDYTVNVNIAITAASMRDDPTPEISLADQEAGVLDRACCLNALAALRHAKWFQAMADGLPSCVIVLRVLRDICSRVPAWSVLNDWILELLVQKCVVSASPDFTKPGDVFRRVMECVASGLFLPGGTGLLDPCEKETADAVRDLSLQERANLTLSAQHALRLIAYEKLHLVLGVDPLPEWSTQATKREFTDDSAPESQVKRTKIEAPSVKTTHMET